MSTSKLSERALRLTQFSVDVAAEAMFTVTPDGRILSANQMACKRLEYSREELVGMRVSDIDPHYTPDVWPQHIEELRGTGSLKFETQHRTKSGRILDVEVSVAHFEFDGVGYLCSSVRDITQRKQAEEILRLQHDVLAKVASTSGVLTETLNEMCRMVERLVPNSLASVMLMDTDGYLRFEAGPQLTDDIRAALEPLQPGMESGSCGAAAYLKHPVLVEDTRTNPHWKALQHVVDKLGLLACWSLPILDERDRALGTFAIAHTRPMAPSHFHSQVLESATHLASIAICRKRFESDLQSAHVELAHVGRLSTMGEMASNLAHELNQPLAAVVNYAYVAEKEIDKERPDLELLRSHVNNIRKDTLRAGDIVSSMRGLARRTAPIRADTSLNSIVCKSLVLLETELRQYGVRLNEDLCHNLPKVRLDSVQIQQVLVNLVRNAIQAMQEVSRENRVLTLATRLTDNRNVELRVQDSGIGIPASDLEAVFGAFYTTKVDGMGMGLAISRSIAEAHSGRLVAEQAPQGGTIFRLLLPIVQEGD